MSYIESDNKELQDLFEQLVRAVQDLESSDNLTQFERDEKAKFIRQLNRRYEVLNNRAQHNRVMEMKLEHKSQLKKILGGIAVGIVTALLWFITIKVLIN